MSAQPHEPSPPARTRPEPTIRSVRAALPPDQRRPFNEEIERTPLHLVAQALADWDLRARAHSVPGLLEAARGIEDRRRSGAPRPAVLSDDEVRALFPQLRP